MKQHIVERMLYIILVLVFIAAMVASYVSIKAYKEFTRQQEVLQQQVAGQKEVLKGMQELLSNQGKTTGEINKSLSCILVFFGKVDRANFYISDLATCTITNIDTNVSEVLPLPALQPQRSAPQGSTAPSSQSPQPTQPTTPAKPVDPPRPPEPEKPTGFRSVPLLDGVLKLLGL